MFCIFHTNEIGSALSGSSLCLHFLHNSFHQSAQVPLVAGLNHIPVNDGISLIKVCQFAHVVSILITVTCLMLYSLMKWSTASLVYTIKYIRSTGITYRIP